MALARHFEPRSGEVLAAAAPMKYELVLFRTALRTFRVPGSLIVRRSPGGLRQQTVGNLDAVTSVTSVTYKLFTLPTRLSTYLQDFQPTCKTSDLLTMSY